MALLGHGGPFSNLKALKMLCFKIAIMSRAPIAFRTNRYGHTYPITTGTADLSVSASPKVDKFDRALSTLVKSVYCSKGNKQIQAISLLGASLRMESLEWPWKWHECEYATRNTFGLDWLTKRVGEICQDCSVRPVLGVVAASRSTGGRASPQMVAVVEALKPERRHYLRLQLARDAEQSTVARGRRIAAGTIVALGVNGSINWVYSTNTFLFDCLDEGVSPDELDLSGSGPENFLI